MFTNVPNIKKYQKLNVNEETEHFKLKKDVNKTLKNLKWSINLKCNHT